MDKLEKFKDGRLAEIEANRLEALKILELELKIRENIPGINHNVLNINWIVFPELILKNANCVSNKQYILDIINLFPPEEKNAIINYGSNKIETKGPFTLKYQNSFYRNVKEIKLVYTSVEGIEIWIKINKDIIAYSEEDRDIWPEKHWLNGLSIFEQKKNQFQRFSYANGYHMETGEKQLFLDLFKTD